MCRHVLGYPQFIKLAERTQKLMAFKNIFHFSIQNIALFFLKWGKKIIGWLTTTESQHEPYILANK